MKTVPRRAIALIIFLLMSAGVSLYAFFQGWLRPELIHDLVAESGPLGMVAYVVAVVVLELLWVPRSWGLFAGGALFGPLAGGLLSIIADMIGAVLCYWIASTGGKTWVRGLLSRRPKAARIAKLLTERRGGMTIAFLRIAPIAHYTVVSYAAGVTGVRFMSFVTGTAIGILPGAALYPYIGHSATDPSSPQFLVAVGALLIALVVTMFLSRRFLRDKGGTEEDTPEKDARSSSAPPTD